MGRDANMRRLTCGSLGVQGDVMVARPPKGGVCLEESRMQISVVFVCRARDLFAWFAVDPLVINLSSYRLIVVLSLLSSFRIRDLHV